MSDRPISPRIENLFAHLAAMYGGNKVAAMFAKPGMEEGSAVQAIESAKRTWEGVLAPFRGSVLAKALQSLIDMGKEWPPTLPEFVSHCRDAMRTEAKPFVMLPPAASDRERGLQEIAKLAEAMRSPRPAVQREPKTKSPAVLDMLSRVRR